MRVRGIGRAGSQAGKEALTNVRQTLVCRVSMIDNVRRESTNRKFVGQKKMKREESLLNLICVLGAAGFFALIAYDLIAGGSIISTDGLFFIVVPLVFALAFLAVPGMEFLERQLAKRRLAAGSGSGPQLAAVGGASAPRLSGVQGTPALKDAKGRSMPPDVSRMVNQMNAGKEKE